MAKKQKQTTTTDEAATMMATGAKTANAEELIKQARPEATAEAAQPEEKQPAKEGILTFQVKPEHAARLCKCVFAILARVKKSDAWRLSDDEAQALAVDVAPAVQGVADAVVSLIPPEVIHAALLSSPAAAGAFAVYMQMEACQQRANNAAPDQPQSGLADV